MSQSNSQFSAEQACTTCCIPRGSCINGELTGICLRKCRSGTDAESYMGVGVPAGKIFIINPRSEITSQVRRVPALYSHGVTGFTVIFPWVRRF